MLEFKSIKLKQALKGILKKEGITYEMIAEKLECSVPTIKRILGPEELSLSRLIAICELANLSLSELEALAQEEGPSPEELSSEQQEYLAANKHHFSYFLHLLGGKSPKQIAETFGLSKLSTDRYLLGLEKNGLIKVTAAQQVKLAFKKEPGIGAGKLAKLYFQTFIKGASTFFIDVIGKKFHRSLGQENNELKTRIELRSRRITQESFEAWNLEYKKLINDLETMCRYEEKTKESSELKEVVIFNCMALVDRDHESLKILENTLGSPPNI